MCDSPWGESLGIYMIREIMKGIRIVKCYAWEAAMEVAPGGRL